MGVRNDPNDFRMGYCPLLKRECIKSKCQFWNKKANDCAVAVSGWGCYGKKDQK